MDTSNDDISNYMQYLKSTVHGTDPQALKEYELYLRSQPGKTPDNPRPIDMFSDSQRIGIGFGDHDNVAYQGDMQGFKHAHLDPQGNVIAQDKQGHYIKDATNFWPNEMNKTPVTDLSSAGKAAKEVWESAHPRAWIEANLGPALRGAGWLAGGIAGDALGGGVGPLATAGAVAGAGMGALAGDKARQFIGKLGGVYHSDMSSPESNEDAMEAATDGMLGEAGGRAIGAGLGYAGSKVSMPKSLGGGNLTDAVKKGISKVAALPSWAMMGGSVPYADVARVVEQPQAVSAAGERGFGLRTAEKMESELNQNVGIEKQKIQQAHDEFRSKYGTTYPDMSTPVSEATSFLERHTPSTVNPESRLTPQERVELFDETSKMSDANAGTLLTQAQRLGESLPGKTYDGSVSQRGDLTTGQLKRMSGGIKGVLHDLDSEGLGAADSRFSQKMNSASTLRPVEGESQESVVNGLWGKNYTARQEAAKELTPNVYDKELLDLRSKQAFDNQGLLGATPKEAMTRGVVAGLLGEKLTSHAATSPETIGLIAAILAGQSPKVNYYGLQTVGRGIQKLPEAELYSRLPQNPWSLLNKEQK